MYILRIYDYNVKLLNARAYPYYDDVYSKYRQIVKIFAGYLKIFQILLTARPPVVRHRNEGIPKNIENIRQKNKGILKKLENFL